MKKSIFVVSLVILFSLLLGACGQKSEAYTVGTDATFPPFEMMDNDKNLIGFDIELMDMIAEEAGIEIEFKNTSFDALLAGIQHDVVYNIYHANIRKEPPRRKEVAVVRRKIGRNDPCPCGSGKKYKHCCGK